MSKPAKPIILHGFKLSGHSHRAELLLRLLGLPFEFRMVDLPAGEQKGAAFLKLNPFGTVPVIEDDGFVLADSVAILIYLATKYDSGRTWLPLDPAGAAEIQRWLSVAQGPVYGGPCAARLVKLFGRELDYDRAKAAAEALFSVLDAHLAGPSSWSAMHPPSPMSRFTVMSRRHRKATSPWFPILPSGHG